MKKSISIAIDYDDEFFTLGIQTGLDTLFGYATNHRYIDSLEDADVIIQDFSILAIKKNISLRAKDSHKKIFYIAARNINHEPLHCKECVHYHHCIFDKDESLQGMLNKIEKVISKNINQGSPHACKYSNGMKFSMRERQYMTCIALGMPINEIAESFQVNTKTVSLYKRNVMRKLGIATNVNLLKFIREIWLFETFNI
ncbi:hypothetical protein FH968_08945 [Buttiauxella sp. B2]|uniref:helix-turn-helix transcriptional regulator n=1 Tax=Buttiauxella sp. B2 TaxID=2587812 RepID=UPI0011221CF7|nr:LuxR family transcriptional regulator [Buttiauxella sp. B2]TNV20564.1 hypothetical protein FH968_08945 [Buttiauxella sp. B2]